jgi:hypothetical protein
MPAIPVPFHCWLGAGFISLAARTIGDPPGMKRLACRPTNMPALDSPHKKGSCEIRGCRVNFLLGGRHHCRTCGLSVCSDHFKRPLCDPCQILAKQAAEAEVLKAEALARKKQELAKALMAGLPQQKPSAFARCCLCKPAPTAKLASEYVQELA